jgi:hypothetical protein
VPTGEPSPAAVAGQAQAASRASNVASSDDALLDLGDSEPPPAAMTEADDFFLDLLDEPPVQARSSAPSFHRTPGPPVENPAATSTAEEMDASARVDYEEETVEPAPQAQRFGEPQVLSEESRTESAPTEEQASPVAEYQSAQEAQPVQEAQSSRAEDFSADTQLAPTERLPDNFQAEQTPSVMGGTENSAAATASPFTDQITLDQLSPEVIDAIARRAVEQLSERVVEQIAWEVVPDLAELIIKRRLEEGKQ